MAMKTNLNHSLTPRSHHRVKKELPICPYKNVTHVPGCTAELWEILVENNGQFNSRSQVSPCFAKVDVSARLSNPLLNPTKYSVKRSDR
jgi:hypothetical protein